MSPPAGGLLVLSGPSKPDQVAYNRRLVLALEPANGEAYHCGGSNSERPAPPGVGQHSVQPACLVERERDRGFPFVWPRLWVADSCHFRSIAWRLRRLIEGWKASTSKCWKDYAILLLAVG
jgi:hypothetical protein